MAGAHPITVWRPLPPRGYLEVGHVVVPALEEPMPNAVRCIRADLVTQAQVFDFPIFSLRDTSPNGTLWQCSFWQVDNPAQTFMTVKALQKPSPDAGRAPTY